MDHSDVINNVNSTFQNNRNLISGATERPFTYSMSKAGLVMDLTALKDQNIIAVENSEVLLLKNTTTYSLQKLGITIMLLDEKGYIYCVASTKTISLNIVNLQSNDTTFLELSDCDDSCTCNYTGTSLPSLRGSAEDVLNITFIVAFTLDGSNQELGSTLYMSLRDCVQGEIQTPAKDGCLYCEFGKYSLNIENQSCDPCPSLAKNCPGGNIINVPSGYWKAPNSDQITECPGGSGVCLGGPDSLCNIGSKGPLCVQCREEDLYLKIPSGDCGSCASNKDYQAVLSMLATVIYQGLFVHLTYQGNISNCEDPFSDPVGTYMRMLSYFFSLVQMLQFFMDDFKSLFTGMQVAGVNLYPQLTRSTDCILIKRGITGASLVGIRIIIMILIPAAKILIALVAMLVMKARKKIDKVKSYIILIFGCFYLSDQIPINTSLVNFFVCTEFVPNSGQYFIDKDPNVQCYTYEWYSLLFGIVIPGMTFWSLFLPLIFLRMIQSGTYKTKEEFKDFYVRYGHFFLEFKHTRYYWGLLRISNTTILLILMNAIQQMNIKCAAVFIYMCVYYYLLNRVSPYRIGRIGTLEKKLVIVFALSVLIMLNASTETSFHKRLIFLTLIGVTNIVGGFFVCKILVIRLLETVKLKLAEFKQKKEDKKEKELKKSKPNLADAIAKSKSIKMDVDNVKSTETVTTETKFQTARSTLR